MPRKRGLLALRAVNSVKNVFGANSAASLTMRTPLSVRVSAVTAVTLPGMSADIGRFLLRGDDDRRQRQAGSGGLLRLCGGGQRRAQEQGGGDRVPRSKLARLEMHPDIIAVRIAGRNGGDGGR